jgi:heme/copper-type cytochrome/quinol oxidase subunit 3
VKWLGILHSPVFKACTLWRVSPASLVTLVRNVRGHATANEVDLLGLFWHFVDFVWNIVFVFLYPSGVGS